MTQELSEKRGSPGHGPHADADWSKATVTLYVPVHGTAITTTATWQITLPELAALLKGMADG